MIIRWVCEKDNKKWLYPIEKCVYCKQPVKKLVSIKAKIAGITKVNIPSPMHPIIPYNILLLEDEHGNRIPKKTMKKYKIGDLYEVYQAGTEGAVIVIKVKYDIKEYLNESLRLLNNYDLNEKDKVLIKSSIIEPAYNYQAVNTNPKVVGALIEFLKDKGIKDIIVAEQAMLGNDVTAAAKKSGIMNVCKEHDVEFVDLSKAEYVEKEVDGFRFEIAKEVLERKLINVPVMKTNSQLVISGAMENLIRVVDAQTQKNMFKEDIGKTLPKLIKALPEFLTIGDATLGMQGDGPTALGEPAFLNMIFLSKDAIALDSVFCQAFTLPIPDYVKEAVSIGVGQSDIKNIEIVGEDFEAIKYPIKQADKSATAHSKIKLVNGNADPGVFNAALRMSSKLFGVSGHELNLVIGSHVTKEMLDGKQRIVAYGNDAIQRVKELGFKDIAEIPEDIDDIEKIMLLKGILEDENKEKITQVDKLKSKMAKFGVKIKRKVS